MTETHETIREGKVFEEGSWGAQFYEGLEPQPSNGDVVVIGIAGGFRRNISRRPS